MTRYGLLRASLGGKLNLGTVRLQPRVALPAKSKVKADAFTIILNPHFIPIKACQQVEIGEPLDG